MEKFRIGLIGCGGRMKAHIQSFLAMPDSVEIVAVADPIESRRLDTAKLVGAKRVYKNHTELYDNESRDTLDAVIIAIEPTAHTDTETRAIDMGIPFLVEKPMTLDLDKARRIAGRIEETGLVTAVGFQDRYLNLMEMVKDELPKHTQGGVVTGRWAGGIPGVWWWQRKADCGGQLVEQNIHLLDGLRFLYGEAESIYAVNCRGIVKPGVTASKEYDTDDYSVCLIKFKNNVTATLTSSCYSRGVRPDCGLMITLDDMVIDYHLRNNLILKTEKEVRDIYEKNNQTYALDLAFIEAVKANDPTAVRSPYADALKTLELAFAANRSMETGEVIRF